jgi:hypothetical protein
MSTGQARRRRRQLDLAEKGEVDDTEPKVAEPSAQHAETSKAASNDASAAPATHAGKDDETNANSNEKKSSRRRGGGDDDSEAAGIGSLEKSHTHDQASNASSRPASVPSRPASVAGSAKRAGSGDEAGEVGGPKENDGSESARTSQPPGTSNVLEDDDSKKKANKESAEDEVPSDGKILQVTVHGTDELKPNIYLIHPVVQLSIVDIRDGGKCVKKRNVKRNIVLQHENATERDLTASLTKQQQPKQTKDKNQNASPNPAVEDSLASPMRPKPYERVLPVQTQPYDLCTHLREGKLLQCWWEESICLDEDWQFFMNPHFVFVFELMDFIHTMDPEEEVKVKKHQKYRGWKRIAWGFLRANEVAKSFIQIGEKIRLQLYKYRSFWFWQHPKGVSEDAPLAYAQWKAGSWKPYKSTLFVTVGCIQRPTPRLVGKRALMPWESEEGQDSRAGLKKGDTHKDKRRDLLKEGLDKTRLGKKWLGATGKWCKVPNTCMHKLESDHRGCLVLAFSTFGTYCTSRVLRVCVCVYVRVCMHAFVCSSAWPSVCVHARSHACMRVYLVCCVFARAYVCVCSSMCT